MSTLMNAVKRFWSDEEGVTAIEYGLIAALIAVVIILALTQTGEGVNKTFECVAYKLDNTKGAAGSCPS